jgi:two-component system response regulator ChvI
MIPQSELSLVEMPRPAAVAGHSTVPVPRRMSVLVIDDDDLYRDALCAHLADEGFDVASFGGGRAGLDHLAAGNSADVILLDWRMPELNGLEVLRELRERGTATPVIFLTALNDDVHEEAALAGGAVDFIAKSRRIAILIKRIELIAEGQKPAPDPAEHPVVQFRVGELELRFDINRAFWRGQVIELTLTEFRMVSQLAMKPGEDVSYRELYDLVHGKDFRAGYGADGFRTNVRTFIKRIRKKFRSADPVFGCIQNYASFGYRWVTG